MMIQAIDMPDGSQRLGKSVKQLYDELQGSVLTAPQKAAIWADISADLKYFANGGYNEVGIAIMHFFIALTAPAGATLTAARSMIVAFYIQDKPFYLVNPSFDPTINLPGYFP